MGRGALQGPGEGGALSRAQRRPGHGKRHHLRLIYEASPLAFIVEQAGGRASTGLQPILDLQPEKLHQRVPLVIGSAGDVAEAEGFITS